MAKIIKEVCNLEAVVLKEFVIAEFDTREEAIEKLSDFKKFMIGEHARLIDDVAILIYYPEKTISYSVEG